MTKKCYSVIIAGGKGTRFWPLSRATRPKQLLKILSRKSLIQETAERVYPLSGRKRTLVVTIADQLASLRRELGSLRRENFLAEPQGKNTAPCIGLAALEVVRRDPEAVMIVLPADHWVADVAAFRQTLGTAIKLAQRHDQLITIGVRPDYPETGYGYILKAQPIGQKSEAAFVVRRFIEKPTLAIAKRLIRQGCLWNSGIFVWKASVLLDCLAHYQPAIYRVLRNIERRTKGRSFSGNARGLRGMIAAQYKKIPNLSIDYAVMERAGAEGRVLILQAKFGWSDVGSWAAIHRMMSTDLNGNASRGRWLGIDAKNCLIHAPDRLVAVLGIENAVIVDTPDALLVGDLHRSQEVRELVDMLNRRGMGSYTI